MSKKTIIGLHLSERVKEAVKVQDILTKYGCSIKTRIGLHDANEEFCSPCGLIILELTGEEGEYKKLENELLSAEGVTLKKMEFEC